jgi:TPR repeat protein
MLKSLLFKTFILSFCCTISLTAAYAMEKEKESSPSASIDGKIKNASPDDGKGRRFVRAQRNRNKPQGLETTEKSSDAHPGQEEEKEKEKEEDKIIEKPQRRVLPKFEPMQPNKLPALFDRAKGGDREAQAQYVNENYWGFLNMGACNYGFMYTPPLNVPDWEDIEQRAKDNHHYAFTLINSYAALVQNRPSNESFANKFPKLFESLQKKAESGDADAQFNLGVVYRKFFGPRLGLQLKSDPREIADEWFIKAAAQDHPHAQVALGLLCASGQSFADCPFGRNPVAALRWFYASKDTKTSQENLRGILSKEQFQRTFVPFGRQSQAPHQEGTFLEELEKIKFQLNSLLGEHSLQAKIHHPEGTFPDHQFAIPELSSRYAKVVEVEEQALNILTSLENSRPGFMTQFTVGGANKEQIGRMISHQTQPHFVAIHDIKGVSYLTLGEENVTIATHFLAYLEGIEEKFDKAEKILKKDGKSYQRRLDLHSDELKETRLLCLAAQKTWQKDCSEMNKKKLDEEAKRFNEQEQKYEEMKLLLKPTIKKMKEERALLAKVKEDIQTLVQKSLGKRNHDFIEDNPYLK